MSLGLDHWWMMIDAIDIWYKRPIHAYTLHYIIRYLGLYRHSFLDQTRLDPGGLIHAMHWSVHTYWILINNFLLHYWMISLSYISTIHLEVSVHPHDDNFESFGFKIDSLSILLAKLFNIRASMHWLSVKWFNDIV